MPAKRPDCLGVYRRKRDFTRTPEPSGASMLSATGEQYVMHWHAARHDHFDLRLEQDGVLRSWALPRGPSLKRGEKRLAVEVEDHPVEYRSFEGTIPKGEYGGGTVMLWDAGRWWVTGKRDDDQLDFALDGVKLKGRWTLVRTKLKSGKPARNWLLIKRGAGAIDPAQTHDRSIRSGRSMDEIAGGADVRMFGGAGANAADIRGARARGMPVTFSPQLATRAIAAPDGDEWLHEIKFDGYRIIAYIRRGSVRLHSRNGQDYTERFSAQAEQLKSLAVSDAILDGEIVALDADGATDFGELQARIRSRDTASLVMQLFDLVHLDGHDLTAATLIDRKHALSSLLAASPMDSADLLRYSDHVSGKGQAFFEQACALGLEGAIAKRANARYTSRRSRTWLKLKCPNHQDFLVGGYTRPRGAREGFGALLLGVRVGNELRYAGRVGSGFSDQHITQLTATLGKQIVVDSPFSEAVPNARGAVWVKPETVVKVAFTERTRNGHLRHPTFRALRDAVVAQPAHAAAKPSRPRAKTRHASGSEDVVESIRITNAERIIYPEQGITKLELARYYADIQDWLLPFLANRLLSLVRCPDGREQPCFFQKHLTAAQARQVPRHDFMQSRGVKQYAYIQSIAHVIALVQAGVMEFHPFGSLVTDPERPDLMVFDLDPSPGVPWPEVLRTARELRQRLTDFKLPSFVRTTGGKGLHLVVPLRPTLEWDGVKEFSKAVSERHAADDPRRLTTSISKAKRQNMVFIDYLRNARGATAIACYFTRARPGAPVAVPLRWDELKPGLRPDHYSIDNLRRRLGSLRNIPWGDFYDARVAITRQMRRSVGLE